jgi:hypothetical protein
VNDLAIAVTRLRSKGYSKRVLIVDLDIHDGNGTRAAFREDATVHTFSIHNETWDDGPAVEDTRIALGSGVTDGDYLAAVRKELPPVVMAFQPSLVLYVAGADPAADDHLGDWDISEGCLLARDRFVFEQARDPHRPVPFVVVLGGGYGEKSWRYHARFFGWMLSGRELDPQEDIDTIVRRFRRIETEASRDVARRPPGSEWRLSSEDLMPGMARASESRLFGHFTRHGLELQLERLGILDQMRARGYKMPSLAFDSGSELGCTVRIYGDAERSEILMELRARRDGTAVPGADLLYVEWLLLQHPRGEFSQDRPRLPGQERPGLGLLRELVAFLVVVCEQAGLDGIVFVPAHYFMAALGRRHLRWVSAEDAAVFEAMREATRDLNLAAATRAIEEGRVVDAESGTPVAWHTPKMILPVSDRMRRKLKQPEFDDEFAAVRSRLSYRVTGYP